MSANWTEKQLEAITARNTAVIVSAAAGSGKTSVLVERLLRILSDEENKTPADRIIVVTFTNDAAAQMKQRLSEALSEKLESEPDNAWLCRQQALIPSAKISTIHSFCFDMIRENVQSLDISAGFRILDDTEESLLVSKAISNVFERFYSEAPDMMNELSDFTGGAARGDEKLESAVLNIYRFLMSIPFPYDWLEGCIEKYSAAFDEKTDPLAEIYSDTICSELKKLASSAEYVSETLEEIGECKAVGIIKDESSAFLEMAEKVSDKDLPWNERFNITVPQWEKCSYPKVAKDSYEAAAVDKLKDMRQKYKDRFKKICESYIFTEEDICDDYLKNHKVLTGIYSIIKSLDAEISSLKSEKNALGFSDAEQLAVKLLCFKDNDGAICKTKLAKELSEYYKLIMIDEFQDANNTQNMIFRMLSHGGTADKNGDDLFVVGDVKQSIYRFRLANPKNFIEVLDSSDIYTPDYSGSNAAILLNRNFRSSNDVVDFVNDVFENLMSKNVGDIDYTESERLEAGAVYPLEDRTTEFIFAEEPENVSEDTDTETPDENENEEAEETESPESVSEVNAEAYAAALKIKSMLGKRNVYEKGELRPCECRDFCILLRDRARGHIYADTLASMGIKAVCEETTGYLRSREIAVLLNLLTVIDNPMRDIPLVSVLMSPMFMLTADETAKLRLLLEDRSCHIYKCVIKALDENCEEKYPAVSKLKRFKEIYDKLRICAASQSLERLIRTIYDSTDFLSSVQVYSDGEQKKANLRLLLEYAKSYEQNSDGGLSGFIRYLNDISDNGKDFVRASIVSPAENAVSIKTIHKSKGLEYPFVFLCGTSKPFNRKDANAHMQMNLEYGIGFKIQDRKNLKLYPSFPQFVMSRLNLNDTLSEELRLLYVALTRAKEQLFITVPDNEKTLERINSVCMKIVSCGGITDDSVQDARSMQDWLLAVLLTHSAGKNIQGDFNIPIRKSSAKIAVSHSEIKTAEAAASPKGEYPSPNEADVEDLIKCFSFKYGSKLPQTAAKLTITEIAKSENDEIFFHRPEFSADISALTPAEIGTAMHTFMQYADYNIAENSAKAQAEELVNKGLLTCAEKNSLQYKKLETFFGSDLYSRMKRSPEIRREQKFLIEISELGLDDELGEEYNNTNGMLQGIADCFFAEEDGIVLVDYKTDRVNNEEELKARYKRQLCLYGTALEKIFGRKVKEAYLYSFGLDREVRIF